WAHDEEARCSGDGLGDARGRAYRWARCRVPIPRSSLLRLHLPKIHCLRLHCPEIYCLRLSLRCWAG
ncbi:unnamed protein product, partial [Urochloa humidicola]